MSDTPTGWGELERLHRFWAPTPHTATVERRRYYNPANGSTPTVDAVVVRTPDDDGRPTSGYVVFYERHGSPLSAQAVLAWWRGAGGKGYRE